MRHGNKKTKLGRPADQRKALLRSLTTELLRHGKIKTTKVNLVRQLVVAHKGAAHTSSAISTGLVSRKCSREAFSYVPPQVKAKAMRKPVDKMITLAKNGTLHARRQVGINTQDQSGCSSLVNIYTAGVGQIFCRHRQHF